jgi:hypothetical protein
LNKLEQQTGHPVSELFDYVAGTSTGGILALGLGLRRPNQTKPYTAAELMSLYIAQGQHIFSRSLLHMVGTLGKGAAVQRAVDVLEGHLRPAAGLHRGSRQAQVGLVHPPRDLGYDDPTAFALCA